MQMASIRAMWQRSSDRPNSKDMDSLQASRYILYYTTKQIQSTNQARCLSSSASDWQMAEEIVFRDREPDKSRCDSSYCWAGTPPTSTSASIFGLGWRMTTVGITWRLFADAKPMLLDLVPIDRSGVVVLNPRPWATLMMMSNGAIPSS